nr:MAG TPA: hypothetical protein [Caudoviricetes sp.]
MYILFFSLHFLYRVTPAENVKKAGVRQTNSFLRLCLRTPARR